MHRGRQIIISENSTLQIGQTAEIDSARTGRMGVISEDAKRRWALNVVKKGSQRYPTVLSHYT